MDINRINPALLDIKGFIGTWEMELSNASFLPDRKTVLKGKAVFEWFEGGDFLVLRQGTKKQVPWATWFIGRDKDAKNYTVLYFDDRQYSRVYEMSFEDEIWKIWRNSPEFTQRFTGEISIDKTTIQGHWEKSTDGKTWGHDFDVKYTKTDQDQNNC